jgi:hypothetical protein
VGDDGRPSPGRIALRDLDVAGKHDQHAGAGLAGLGQQLAVGVRPPLPEAAQLRDVRRRKDREHLVVSGIEDRRLGHAPIIAIVGPFWLCK